MSRRVLGTVLEIAVPLALLGLWAAWSAGSETYYFPPLTDILETFADTWLFERVGSDVVPSLVRLGLGYGIACVVAVGLGLALGLSRRLRLAFDPVVQFLRSVPPPALLPFGILVLGVGTSMKVFIIAFVCLWPVLLNTIDGVAGVDPTLRETADSYGIPRGEQVRRVILPAAAPQIFAGMRTSLSLALILMVISEMVASTNGIGYFVLQSQRSFAIPEMWSGILLLGLLGYALNAVFVADRAARPAVAPRRTRERLELTMGDPMLHVEHLKKDYGDVHAVGDLSFDVAAGELVCVVGPSGCGKTTLLKCVAGLLEPSSGEVTLEGAPVHGPPDTMALVFQEYSRSLFPWMSVRQNVAFPLRGKGKDEARAARRGRARLRRARRRDGPLPVAAVGRDAAARRDRARARLPAADPAHGRAVRLGRRPDPRRPRGPGARGAAPLRGDDPLRHPRHRRGGLPERPHRRPDPVADRGARGARGRAAPAARPGGDEGAAGFRAPAGARVADDQATGRGGCGVGELILPPAYADDRDAHPPLDSPDYGSTRLRHPSEPLIAVPQTLTELTGPLLGEERVQPSDADLTIQHAGEPLGERIVVHGRVLEADGRPVRDTLVEIWQTNSTGRYRHPGDQHPAPLDPNFTGLGRCLTDGEGRYRFVTIKPGAYPWGNHENAWRPAHIHFSLFGRAFTQRLVTQMYFPGDPLFAHDPIFNSVRDPSARERMICAFDLGATVPEWALAYRWDIVLRGPRATPPDEDGA